MSRAASAVLLALLPLTAGCGHTDAPLSGSPSVATTPSSSPARLPPSVFVGAGDIGWCGSAAPEATAKLLDGIDGTVFTAGDNAQHDGSWRDFIECYDPTWGRHKARTRPVAGNHDYESGGAPYYEYFGANAGPVGLGYYSYDLGSWHIVALNSNLPVDSGSSQVFWLRQDLQATRASCTLAYWHHPLFSGGTNGGSAYVRDLWHVLYEYGADVVLNGHDHLYQRYAPMDPNGRFDLAHGIREFVVGTGGAPLYPLVLPPPNLETSSSTHGVFKLTLSTGSYAWEFRPIPGETYHDTGSDTCR